MDCYVSGTAVESGLENVDLSEMEVPLSAGKSQKEGRKNQGKVKGLRVEPLAGPPGLFGTGLMGPGLFDSLPLCCHKLICVLHCLHAKHCLSIEMDCHRTNLLLISDGLQVLMQTKQAQSHWSSLRLSRPAFWLGGSTWLFLAPPSLF